MYVAAAANDGSPVAVDRREVERLLGSIQLGHGFGKLLPDARQVGPAQLLGPCAVGAVARCALPVVHLRRGGGGVFFKQALGVLRLVRP